ncbi:hypothetical protein B0H19DRAFT_1070298 [Mycena capillaripes]|nr:hypothetical protein B0H19DRAFT_1070298 [Mycena capillaripes]
MFSKLIALGLCAFTLSAAAPSQQPMVSQELTISCAISQVGSTTLGSGTIQPGVYRIASAAARSFVLTVDLPDSPVFTEESWSANTYWRVSPAGANNYRIISDGRFPEYGIGAHEGQLYLALPPAVFSISPAAGNTFTVQVPGANRLWTVIDPGTYYSSVELKGADGNDAQRWIFTRIK